MSDERICWDALDELGEVKCYGGAHLMRTGKDKWCLIMTMGNGDVVFLRFKSKTLKRPYMERVKKTGEGTYEIEEIGNHNSPVHRPRSS